MSKIKKKQQKIKYISYKSFGKIEFFYLNCLQEENTSYFKKLKVCNFLKL